MIFKRTSGALFSLHKFFSVDKVIYCEGGDEEIDFQDIQAGRGAEETGDIRYWQEVTRFLGSSIKYKFKSVGSKTVAIAIAREIVAQQISTIVVCLDRDYDWHLGSKLTGDGVVYTYGYSFENDVISVPALRRLLARLIGRGDATRQLAIALEGDFRKFSKAAAYWSEADISLVAKNKPAIIPKSKPGYCILAGSTPQIDEAKLRRDLISAGYRRRPRRVVIMDAKEGVRHTYGKAVLLFVYAAFMERIKKHDRKITLSKDVFLRLLITETFEAIEVGELPELGAYLSALRPQFRLIDSDCSRNAWSA
jgi:hypothetical protein